MGDAAFFMRDFCLERNDPYDISAAALCHCGCGLQSINEAAKSLFISQPSLSGAIKELESETGVELFRRTNRGVTVTPEGEEFLGYARQVCEQYRLIENRYITKQNVRKKFSVSMQHYSFAVKAFVELVKQFGMDEYEFAVHETMTYEVIENVRTFKSEIGILYLNEFNQNVLTKLFRESSLEFHSLFECRIYDLPVERKSIGRKTGNYHGGTGRLSLSVF